MSRTYRLRRMPRFARTAQRFVDGSLNSAYREAEEEESRRVAHDVLGLPCVATPNPDPADYIRNGYENRYRKRWLMSHDCCLDACGIDRWKRGHLFTPHHLLLRETAAMGCHPYVHYGAWAIRTKKPFRRIVHKSARGAERRLLRITKNEGRLLCYEPTDEWWSEPDGWQPEFDHDEVVYPWRDKLLAEALWNLT